MIKLSPADSTDKQNYRSALISHSVLIFEENIAVAFLEQRFIFTGLNFCRVTFLLGGTLNDQVLHIAFTWKRYNDCVALISRLFFSYT